MNISAKTEYACIAVLELAHHYEAGRPLRIRQIADAHGIPARFLVQILLQLKGAGIVGSTRGASGGYRLSTDPSEITLGRVMSAVDPQLGEPARNAGKETPASRTLQETWNEITAVQREKLEGITFADLVARIRSRHSEQDMYYI